MTGSVAKNRTCFYLNSEGAVKYSGRISMVLLMPYALIDLLLGLRQFLRIENPLKMMKNVFFILYFCS